jgi:hypothetical protein
MRWMKVWNKKKRKGWLNGYIVSSWHPRNIPLQVPITNSGGLRFSLSKHDLWQDECARYGFRGSPYGGNPCSPQDGPWHEYDYANLAMTYTALCTLIILGDSLERVNKRAILQGMKRLQQSNGRYMSFVWCKHEWDLRQVKSVSFQLSVVRKQICGLHIAPMPLVTYSTTGPEWTPRKRSHSFLIVRLGVSSCTSTWADFEDHRGTIVVSLRARLLNRTVSSQSEQTLHQKKWPLFLKAAQPFVVWRLFR